MYILYRKDYYKRTIYPGIVLCIMCGVLSYHSIARRDEFPDFLKIMLTIWIITVTLYYLIKYLRKDKDFVVLRIDDNGILLCQKKNEEVFIEWEKIKHVIFLHYNGGSKVIVRQHNKETHELFFTINYYEGVMPRGAIKAAYKYTDDRDKIMEVGSFLDPVYTYTRDTTYGDIMYDLYEKERKKRDRERKREREKRLKEKREKKERKKRLKEERKKREREKY